MNLIDKVFYNSIIFISNCSVKIQKLCLKPYNFKLLPLLWISRIYKCVKEKRVKRVRGDAVALSTTYTLTRIRIKEWYSGPLCHKTNALYNGYVKYQRGYLTELQNNKEKFSSPKPFLDNQTAAIPKVIRHSWVNCQTVTRYIKTDSANIITIFSG